MPEVVDELGKVNRYLSHIRVLKSKTGAQRENTSNSAEVLARWKIDLREYLDKNKLCFELNGVELKRDKEIRMMACLLFLTTYWSSVCLIRMSGGCRLTTL